VRVLLFTDTLADVNGVSRFLRDAARHTREAGRDLTIVTSTRLPCPDGPNIVNLSPRAGRSMPGYSHLEVVTPPLRRALALVDRLRPDVVHVSTPGPVGLAGRRAALKRGVPLVGVYHTDFPTYVRLLFDDDAMSWATRRVMRWFYGPFRTLLTRSAAYARPLLEMGFSCRRIVKLRPGTDVEVFHPRHRDDGVWDRFGISRGSVKVLSATRVSVEKNLPMLARVWRRVSPTLASRGIEADLVVLGDGPYHAEMVRALAGARAHFLGFRSGPELSTLYASADLFVFPSRTDTLGQVVMEAQASGLPVLVSDDGGPREVVLPGRTGLVLPGTDEGAWAGAIESLASDRVRLGKMGAAARAHIAPQTIASSIDHFWNLHERALEGGVEADACPERSAAPTKADHAVA